MSQTTPPTAAGSGMLPPPTPFAPSAEGARLPDVEPRDTVVLLLASQDDPVWAANAAVALSSAWARDGRRIVLADLHLENPVLHERVGAANLEGVVDIFLYGASIARSARPVRGRNFYLITAGTYEPDAAAIYRHPRWQKLVAGFRDAGASLVLFAPLDTADLEALSRWSGQVVLLGAPSAPGLLSPLARAGIAPDALLVPPGTRPPAFREPEPEQQSRRQHQAEVEPQAPAPAAPVIVEMPPSAPAAPVEETRPPAGAAEERVPEHPAERDSAPVLYDGTSKDLLIPPPPERVGPRPQRTWLWVLLVLVLAAVVGGIAFALSRSRSQPVGAAEAAPAPATDTAVAAAAAAPAPEPAPPPAPTRAGEPLPYSVHVKTLASLPAARQEVAFQQRRFPEVPFFISPENVGDRLYYRVMVGPLLRTEAATELRDRLVSGGAVDEEDAAGSWDLIWNTPLAFDLGERPSANEARAAADSLRVREIPSYAVEVPYSDGSRRWRLYGGAYRDSASAEAMRQRLSTAGLQPRLVQRVGAAANQQESGEG